MGSVLAGRPFLMAWTWWRYSFAGLTALIANGASRLGLFIWEWKAFGSGKYWWHGEGVWVHTYEDCDKILKSQQNRHSAFGCIRACIPDLFATSILIFLPNSGTDSEWFEIRRALHDFFLDRGMSTYKSRLEKLPQQLAAEWPNPEMSDLNDIPKLQKAVASCIFYMLFGKWIEGSDAEILSGWRTNATFFILPRVMQRFLFNIGINKVKKLRENTVGIVERYGCQAVFERMNDQLGRWKRNATVKLCDEIMYVVGFAGIGGTSAAVESVAAFLQVKIPKESAAKHIFFGKYDTQQKMVAKYTEDSEKYIRETCRMVPPVTSATASLKEDTQVEMAGKEIELQAGILNQYVLSMANRDETLFADPEIFDPDRANLNMAFTWNGAFGAQNEGDYPRICPGRYLSLEVTTIVINHILGIKQRVREKAPVGMC